MTRARHGEAAAQPRWRGCVLLPSTRLPSTILESKAGSAVVQVPLPCCVCVQHPTVYS